MNNNTIKYTDKTTQTTPAISPDSFTESIQNDNVQHQPSASSSFCNEKANVETQTDSASFHESICCLNNIPYADQITNSPQLPIKYNENNVITNYNDTSPPSVVDSMVICNSVDPLMHKPFSQVDGHHDNGDVHCKTAMKYDAGANANCDL